MFALKVFALASLARFACLRSRFVRFLFLVFGMPRAKGDASQQQLRREILQCLFGSKPRRANGTARPQKPRQGDWKCDPCGFSNFGFRTVCFKCSKQKGAKKSAETGVSSKSPTVSLRSTAGMMPPTHASIAPWAKAGEASKTAAALQESLRVLKSQAGNEVAVKLLEEQLAKALKEASAPPKPLSDQLAGTREYLDRAAKRRAKAVDAVTAAKDALADVEADIAKHERHLIHLEQQALVGAVEPVTVERVPDLSQELTQLPGSTAAQDLTQLPGTPRDADLSVLQGSDAELEAPQLTQSVREELQSTASRIDVLLPGSGEVLTNLLRGKGFGKGPGARYSPA